VGVLRHPYLRPTAGATGYVLAVAAAVTVGFVTGSPVPVLLAAAASLPASLLSMPLFYLVYGLLALVPGANPSSSSGSGSSSTADGVDTAQTTGDPAAWFSATTHVAGVLLLAAGAVADVVLVRSLAASRRRRRTPRPVDQSA
jgi:hypothetical protein